MRKQEHAPNKELHKTLESKLNEMDISNILTEFKVTIMKMFTRLQRRLGELSENCIKEIENMKKNQSELKNITELKTTLEGINRLGDAEEHISNLEDRVMETTQAD